MAFYNCLLFDVDDTLLDFNASEAAALAETLEHFSFPQTDEVVEKYREINKALWAALERRELRQEKLVVTRFQKLLDVCEMKGNAAQINEWYLARLAEHANMFVGADEMLRELSEVATLAVVSNGIESVQMGRLEKSGLLHLFDAVVVSGRVGCAKPARKIFDVALTTLGVEHSAKTLVIGDSLTADIGGGNGAGLATCWCNFGNIPLPEGAPKPKHIVRGYEELLRVVMEEEELKNVGSSEKRHLV